MQCLQQHCWMDSFGAQLPSAQPPCVGTLTIHFVLCRWGVPGHRADAGSTTSSRQCVQPGFFRAVRAEQPRLLRQCTLQNCSASLRIGGADLRAVIVQRQTAIMSRKATGWMTCARGTAPRQWWQRGPELHGPAGAAAAQQERCAGGAEPQTVCIGQQSVGRSVGQTGVMPPQRCERGQKAEAEMTSSTGTQTQSDAI